MSSASFTLMPMAYSTAPSTLIVLALRTAVDTDASTGFSFSDRRRQAALLVGGEGRLTKLPPPPSTSARLPKGRGSCVPAHSRIRCDQRPPIARIGLTVVKAANVPLQIQYMTRMQVLYTSSGMQRLAHANLPI